MHELVEMEVRELLSHYDYDGDNIKFIKGSALCALNGTEPAIGKEAMKNLTEAMDSVFRDPVREVSKDFMMSIEGSLNIAGRGVVATGTVD